MEIHQFNKSLNIRLNEITSILTRPDVLVNAKQVFLEWASFIEISIEPAGWQAIWKIPRITCEILKLTYPVIVFGMVEQVLFLDLQANFRIEAVQDSNIEMAENHVVCLEDLYVTINQENKELNFDTTADVIDAYRFFLCNIWMPWDNELSDDICWVIKYLDARIKFCYELRSKSMNAALVEHIKLLLNEARCIQARKIYLELNLCEEDESEESDEKNAKVTELMSLHLRMLTIRAKLELLENPDMRGAYQNLHFKKAKKLQALAKSSDSDVIGVVSNPTIISEHINMLLKVKQQVKQQCVIQICESLLDVLSKYSSISTIFISPGNHTVELLENLHSCRIIGLMEKLDYSVTEISAGQTTSNDVVIHSANVASVLLVLNANFIFENLVIKCNNTRLGMLVKGGSLLLKNCRVIGDEKSSVHQGIYCIGNSKVVLENCLIENFGTGITLTDKSRLTLTKTKFINCYTGLDWTSQTSKVQFMDTTFNNAKQYGINISNLAIPDDEISELVLNCLHDLNKYDPIPSWTGTCTFNGCAKNIYVINSTFNLTSDTALELMQVDEETL